MNPVESIQNKTSKITEDITNKIKKEIAQIIMRKTEPLISILLWIIFFLLFVISGILSTLGLLIFKTITDWNGNITYGSLALGFLISLTLGLLISVLGKMVLKKKIASFKQDIMNDFE